MKVKKISALLMASAVLAGSVPAQAVFDPDDKLLSECH
mgnify:CR=1 FL=1